jgi:hypothetical protein
METTRENEKRRMEIVDSIASGEGSLNGKILRINKLIGSGAEAMADYIPGYDDGEGPRPKAQASPADDSWILEAKIF